MTESDSGYLDRVAQVTLVGTGLLGGSIGLGLKASGFRGRIVGVGRRQQTVQRAKELGCIDVAETDLSRAIHEASEIGEGQTHLVVLATPLGLFDNLLDQLSRLDLAGVVITDVGSTKQPVCLSARQRLSEPGRFVGSHPMAGSEQHGPDFACPDLFAEKPCIITRDVDSDALAVQTVEAMWRKLGMRLFEMTPQEHDRHVAAVSHLPHAMAMLLVTLAHRGGSMSVASTGFRDTTRVASGDPGVWADIFSSNRAAMAEAIDTLSLDLAALRAKLAANDHAGMMKLLAEAKAQRDRWMADRGDSMGNKGE